SPTGGIYRPRQPRKSPLYQCIRRHVDELRAAGSIHRAVEENTLERFLDCGDLHKGFARVYCRQCRHDYLLAFSCKTRGLCPSCHQKRMFAHGEWVEAYVLAPVPHRQYVFTLPKLLRPHFHYRPHLGELCRLVALLLKSAFKAAEPCGEPAFILYVQTYGDLVTWNPHIHALVADGVFLPNGTFRVLPPIPEALLNARLREAVLSFLTEEGSLDPLLAERMRRWQHSGFSVHNQVKVQARDTDARQRLARYMNRAPFSLDKMTYDANSATVIYRSKLHATLKRNFQLMPGAQWLKLLLQHIPDRYEHLVRYYGYYSNRSRGQRAKQSQPPGSPESESSQTIDEPAHRKAAKAAWAKLIKKIYEVDPMVCPRCGGEMRIIALIEQPCVIQRILKHLGAQAPRPSGPDPPSGPVAWPSGVTLPLTYHPVPDIA
ncbi:MAG: transposase, partial [Acidiferrobacterales bacterium]